MSEGIQLVTARLPWQSLREAVAIDDTPLSVFIRSNMPAVGENPDTGQNTSIDLNGPVFKKSNSVLVAGWGAGGDDQACTKYTLYGIAANQSPAAEGPICELLTGVATLGPQACTVHPLTGAALTANTWIDTWTVTGGLLSGLVEILALASEKICMMKFDTLIFDRLFMEYDEDATGMTAFNAMISGY